MKTVKEILEMIDCELKSLKKEPYSNDYLDGKQNCFEELKDFILEPSAKCEHEWVEVKNWVNLAQQCSKCGEIR